MRSTSPEMEAALAARRLIPRDFIWFVVKDRDTGNPVTDGYWSGAGSVSAAVINPETGGIVTRAYSGAGNLIQVSDIPLVSNLTVQNVQVRLNQTADRVNELVRAYDVKYGRVEIHRALFNVDTRQQVGPAEPRFVGFIDGAPITTPPEGQEGGVTLNCVSHTQEMTRSNPDTRSDASQKLRGATDDFYADTVVVGGWQHFWGRASGPAPSTSDIWGKGAELIYKNHGGT